MSFKQFYKEVSNGVVELNEALEAFYLSESLSSGNRVKLLPTGLQKIKSRLEGAEHPALNVNEFTYYEKLSSVPSKEKSDRELLVIFATKKLFFKKLLNKEMNTVQTDFITELASVTVDSRDEKYDEKLGNVAKKYSKELVEKLIKEYASSDSVRESYTKEEIKKYSKDLLAHFESVEAFNVNLATKYNKSIPKTEDVAYSDFAGTALRGFGAFIRDYNASVGIANTLISDEDLDFLLFGSDKNTQAFERAYASYMKPKEDTPKILKLNRFYLYSESAESLLEVVYNEEQKDTTPVEILSPIEEGEEKETKGGKETKEPKFNVKISVKDHENFQVLGVYFPKAAETYHEIVDYVEKNGQEGNVKSERFKSIIKPLTVAIQRYIDEADRPQLIVKTLNDILDKGNFNDILRVVAYAAGVSKFKHDKAPNHHHVVFEGMNGAKGYRALEASKMGYKADSGDEYGKATTADFILSNVDNKELLNLIKAPNNKLEAASNGSINVVDGEGKVLANYFAVSLKSIKNESGSIGRTHSLVKKTAGDILPSAEKQLFGESVSVEQMLNINEGVFAKLSELGQKGLLKLKELGANFVAKVVKLSQYLRSVTKSSVQKFVTMVNAYLPKAYAALYTSQLQEAEEFKNTNIIKMVEDLFAREDKVALFNRANERITTELKKINNGKVVGNVFVDVKVGTPKKLEANSFKRQIFHYAFIVTFQQLFINGMSESRKQVVEAIHTIVDLYAEAIFGATKLPLWRVYRYQGSDSAVYDNAMSKDSFKKDKKEKLEALAKDMILMHFRGDTADGHLYIDFLVDPIDDEGKQTYATYELGYAGSEGVSSSAVFLNEFKR